MGRQKQLIVPPEDSVVESLRTGDQVQFSGVNDTARGMVGSFLCAQIAAGNFVLARLSTPSRSLRMAARTLNSEHRTQNFACLGMTEGKPQKGIMAV